MNITNNEERDELLEEIWTVRETGKDMKETGNRFEPLEKQGLVTAREGRITLTKTGEEEAGDIIRRHRLTERLFADVLKTSEEVWEKEACELEHKKVLSDEAVNAVCSFLGHPTSCPHGRSIPPGLCCAKFKKKVEPFVMPLTEAGISTSYQIVFITPTSSIRLNRLAVLGILPGSKIEVHQKRPSYVIRSGETDIALDEEVVKDIYVRKA